MGTEDGLSVETIRSHLIFTSLDAGENSKTLCGCLRACNVCGLQTATECGPVLGRLRELGGSTSCNLSDRSGFAILINHCVGRVEWVGAAFRFTFNFGNIGIVVASVTASVLSRLVAHVGLGPWDVVEAHWVTRFPTSHHVGLGLALVDIIDGHGVTDELGGRRWPDLDLLQVVVRV